MRFFRFVRGHGGVVATVITLMAILVSMSAIFIITKFSHFWSENTGILVALFVGLAPSGVLLYSQSEREKRERHNWLLQKREVCLSALVKCCMLALPAVRAGAGARAHIERKMIKKMQKIKSQLILWGREDLFRAWDLVERTHAEGNELDDEKSVRLLDNLFRTIRKELDHNDSAMKPGEAIGVILTPRARKKALKVCKDMNYK